MKQCGGYALEVGGRDDFVVVTSGKTGRYAGVWKLMVEIVGGCI